MNYCLQKTKTDCGPIVLINLNKFFGKNYTLKHLNKTREDLNWQMREGVHFRKFMSILDKLNYIFIEGYGHGANREIQKITEHLKNDLPIIMLYNKPDDPHLILLRKDEVSENFIWLHNHYDRTKQSFVHQRLSKDKFRELYMNEQSPYLVYIYGEKQCQ